MLHDDLADHLDENDDQQEIEDLKDEISLL